MENSDPKLAEEWLDCKNILCIRADHMGDLLMSTPAIAALKSTFDCKITVLTSSKAEDVARLIPEIDRIIVARLPWMKLEKDPEPAALQQLITFIHDQYFDACVIFNVYSQNILPAAMMAYMAGIPLRLAYSRENPYHLLSHWLPDPEPYFYMVHQVERDLDLVRMIGATVINKSLRLQLSPESREGAIVKGSLLGIDLNSPYIILHPGVSEDKRAYPEELWISLGKLLVAQRGIRLLITGAADEQKLTAGIAAGIGSFAFSAGGAFTIEEFTAVISSAQTLVSVNTGTVHLAAAVHKPMVVLYAQTNPQHAPWMVKHQLLEYSIPKVKQSRNQVIRFVNEYYYSHEVPIPSVIEVAEAVKKILDHQE